MNIKDSGKVQGLFNNIARRYDFFNDLFSLGLHRFWKRRLVNLLKPIPGEKWLDLCCGTGDLTISFSRFLLPEGSIFGIDFSYNQLQIARKKTLRRKNLPICWLNEDVLNNCLPGNSFDGVVMAYGLRNLSNIEKGFHEIHRLLKSGGRAGILDFHSMKRGSFGFWFQKLYLRIFVVPTASIFNLKQEYVYIENSLKTFPNGHIQKNIARKIGFIKIRYKLIAGGQMGILLLEKA